MGCGRIPGAPTQADHLSSFHRITDIYQCTVMFQMPISRSNAIGMLNNNKICIRQIFSTHSSAGIIFHYSYDHTIPCSTNLCPFIHFNINSDPVFMRIVAEVTLDDEAGCRVQPVLDRIRGNDQHVPHSATTQEPTSLLRQRLPAEADQARQLALADRDRAHVTA